MKNTFYTEILFRFPFRYIIMQSVYILHFIHIHRKICVYVCIFDMILFFQADALDTGDQLSAPEGSGWQSWVKGARSRERGKRTCFEQ